jgi:TolA-binding protein
LGYAYYKQNDFENAISQFNKIINGKDFVAQNAYYHLGKLLEVR